MNIELSRFRVRAGCAPLVEEWLAFLHDNLAAVLETLDGERMFVESIFSEHLDGVDYLYWYTIQGEGGTMVTASEHWIDLKHLEYWRLCIDDTYPGVDLPSRVTMIPDRIRQHLA